MFIIALFTALSSVQKAGPIGELFYGLLTWCFGYGALALPVLMFYGAAILVRDKDTIKSQKVLVGTFWVQIFSSALFHFYIHPQPLPISVGGDILQRAGGFVSAFIVFPLNNLIDVEMTHAVLLIGLIISVLYMTDIELKDLIGGVQAIFAYIFKFIVAFFKARREASKVNFDQMLAITDEDTETASIKDNVLKNAPHTINLVANDVWKKPYSRQEAAFPLEYINSNKFWPSVSRIDDAFGDRNLVCSCESIESYI